MKTVIARIVRVAEIFCGLMIAALFVVFLLQIISRDLLSSPIGWTLQISLILWIWIVFIGNAFIVRDSDHVSFDVIYQASREKARKVMALISAAAIALAMAWAFLPTYDYIDFLKIKKSGTLDVSDRTILFCYIIFLAVVIIRYAWAFVNIWRNGPPVPPLMAQVEDLQSKDTTPPSEL